MDGPSHYREAERLLEEAHTAVQQALAHGELPRPEALATYAGIVARAQVHATLAVAAATVLDPEDTRARSAWQQVTRVPRPECEHDGCTAEQSVSWDPYCTEHKDDLKAES